MDYVKHSSMQSPSQFNFSQSHSRKVFKLLLSVSVFSIILSHFSFISFLLHSFSAFTSSSPSVGLFSFTFDKNYMFLVCNGLLVFIVKNSGLIGTSPDSPPGSDNLSNDEHALKNTESRRKVVEMAETEASKGKEEVIIVEIEQEQGRELEDDKRVLMAMITQDEEEDEGCRSKSLILFEDHDVYEEGDQGIGLLMSTEELNKKCDDFIRRMKEGIKLEVQQSIMF